jgi:predicted signal transduction protein with EAL and GGDEF domain
MEISYDRNMIRLTMSFGVAAFRASPAMSFNDLVKAADDALYAAKKLRRDRCCVTQTDHSTDKAMAFPQLRHHGGGVHTEPA